MFFINLAKKIFRGIGYFLCAVLLLLCILLAVLAAGFGSGGTVRLLGFNFFVVDYDGIEAVPQGSVVIARDCRPYDLEENELALYNRSTDSGSVPALGYVDEIRMDDGVYYITVSVGNDAYEFSERDLIGSAEKCSEILGSIIGFSRTPVGILVIALLPCAALILYDIIKAAAARRPLPEVVPQLKNAADGSDEPENAPASGITVKPDGNAAYSRNGAPRPAATADSVLFSYAGRQRGADIIPPTDKRADDKKTSLASVSERAAAVKDEAFFGSAPDTETEKSSAKTHGAAVVNSGVKSSESSVGKSHGKTAAKTDTTSSVPAPTAIKRYMDSAVNADGATAELPVITKKKQSDAFFIQSGAPQIAPRRSASAEKSAKAVIDLEDALATAEERSRHSAQREAAGRRSSEILAAKSVSDLITEDDDTLDRSRYEVDDILAGIDRRKKQ